MTLFERIGRLLATTSALVLIAAQGPPDGSTAEQKAIVAADPAFRPLELRLAKIPKAAGPRRMLFNDRDLAGWDSWLGLPTPERTYAPDPGTPIGLNRDSERVFSVVEEDGQPAILANGRIWGGLLTREEFGDYHLHVEFKWGAHNWMPFPRNNGILYHSHGQLGAFFGTWMPALEFEIVPQHVGMLLTVGRSRPGRSFDGVDWNVGARSSVGSDRALAYPWRRYMPGGRVVPIAFPAYNVDAARDAEKPLGAWNSLDLYVLGNRSIHVVNGVPVLAASGLTTRDAPGSRRRPLTRGRIQLQSEGSETYFRNISIEPIRSLPKIEIVR